MNVLIISNILLWVSLIILAFITYALTRQIGILYERIAPAGALMMNRKIKVGQNAPEFVLQTLDAKFVVVGGKPTDGKSQLVFFVSPDCPVCKTLIPTVKSALIHETDWLNLIIASDGPNLDHSAYVREQALDKFPYVVSEILGKTYGVSKLPYAVLIDESGKIASVGIINSREHLESLFEAKERKVASIQEYLDKQSQSL